tara:strand:+ start:4539 stop:5276 length:738 start_codon:yes stop_codon:yes gene_type:complete
MNGLLDNVNKSHVSTYPFTHISKDHVLPQKLYDDLNKTFPEQLIIDKGSHPEPGKYSLSFAKIDVNDVTDIWYNFLEYHTTQYFVDRCLCLFGDHIIKKGLGVYSDLRKGNFGIRYSDKPKSINIDAMFILEDPHKHTQHHSRSPHYDKCKKICGILFYMKRVDDQSNGRDFLMYETSQDTQYDGVYVKNKDSLKIGKTVEYGSNNFVCFPMSPETAVHCAGSFECDHPSPKNRRRYVEVLIEIK